MSNASTLIFFVNGQKITDDSIDPEWTLLTYLRLKLRLCGTKLGCGEGGCGACTVMVSKYNRQERKIEHMSINACLAPIASMHGLAVTTVEGIGSTKTKLHAVQERISKFHGSQCGFCTPGMVMSMYTLLRNNPVPCSDDLDVYFQGNLCRCTGYRPIVEAFRTFTEEHWTGSAVNGMPNGAANGHANGEVNGSTPNGCCGKKIGKCCMEDEIAGYDLEVNDMQQYCPNSEPIFPPELQLSQTFDSESLCFRGANVAWYRPTSVAELLQLKKDYPQAKIVVGNTEIGIETKFKQCNYPVMIQPTHVKELTGVRETESGVVFGAAVTLSEVEKVCSGQSAAHPQWKVKVFTAISKMLQYFGGKQIRNVAAIGGNIMTGSPISDLNPIFLAAGCKLLARSSAGTRSITMDDTFFTGYRRNTIKPEEVLLSIEVPYLQENEHFAAYKQSRRRDDDIAIVNAAFKLKLTDNVVESIAMCFGGMSVTAVFAKNTMDFMLGKTWSKSTIEESLSMLVGDLPLDPSAPGGMVRYRRSLALSFLFKFYLEMCRVVRLGLEPEDQSALDPLTKRDLQSHQLYFADSEQKDSLIAVGKPRPHVSGELHATGEAVFCDDMPRLENELYLGLVLSRKAHAKISNLDASEALKMEGVHSFVCHDDLPGDRNNFSVALFTDEEVFASSEVKYFGQIIGAVLAKDQATAKRAAKKVHVEYEELPVTVTIEDAILTESFFPVDRRAKNGDPTLAFASCDHVIEGEMRTGEQEHFYLETNATVAIPKGEHGEMELISSTQNHKLTQMAVAKCLGVPANRIVCKVKRLGGGFGGKETRAAPLGVVVAVAANKVGRPVRIMLDRDEDVIVSGQRHPFLGKYKVGFNNDGLIQALDLEIYSNCGSTLDLSFSVLERALLHATNAYFVPNVDCKGRCCKTNLSSNTAFRGFGAPQGMMVAENWMNDVALVLGKDPSYIRDKNLFREGQFTYYGQMVEEKGLERCWNDCLKQSSYEQVKHQVAEFNVGSKWKKRGIAIVPTMFGISFNAQFLNQSGAFVNIYTDGSVLLTHGGTEMGQGLHTKMIQVASESLKIDQSKIHIMESSTDKVPNTSPTAASASSDLNGMAIYNACSELVKRLAPYRKEGKTWEEAVNDAYFDQVSLSATGYFTVAGIGYDFETGRGRPANYFTHGAACSVVEIDCLTGDHRMLKTDIVMDVGKSLNPAIDIGQIEGAFIQGYGLFVMEQMVHSPSGVPFTRGPGAYKIPSFDDIPAEFNVTLLKDSPNPRAVYSSKGIGEPPLFLSSSVFFAIKDAIAAAREERGLGRIFKLDSPATVERIRMACEDDLTKRIPLLKDGTFTPWGIQV